MAENRPRKIVHGKDVALEVYFEAQVRRLSCCPRMGAVVAEISISWRAK